MNLTAAAAAAAPAAAALPFVTATLTLGRGVKVSRKDIYAEFLGILQRFVTPATALTTLGQDGIR